MSNVKFSDSNKNRIIAEGFEDENEATRAMDAFLEEQGPQYGRSAQIFEEQGGYSADVSEIEGEEPNAMIGNETVKICQSVFGDEIKDQSYQMLSMRLKAWIKYNFIESVIQNKRTQGEAILAMFDIILAKARADVLETINHKMQSVAADLADILNDRKDKSR